MRSKIMIIGAKGSGKTTIANLIEGKHSPAKGDAISYGDYTLDMPSGYLDNPLMYDALIASNQDAAVVFFLIDATASRKTYPPSFSKSFTGVHCTIITKTDLVDEKALEKAYEEANALGTTSVIEWSTQDRRNEEMILSYRQFCKLLY